MKTLFHFIELEQFLNFLLFRKALYVTHIHNCINAKTFSHDFCARQEKARKNST